MSEGPIFFDKNKIDLDYGDAITITVTDSTATDTGSDYVNYLRNRKLSDGWATTGSNDAANTQVDIDLGADEEFDNLFLINHNFKAFTVQYYNGASYVDFSTPISETDNEDTTNRYEFTPVTAQLIRLIITGTITTDDDKFLSEVVVTKKIGQLSDGWHVKDVTVDKKRTVTKLLSGRVKVKRTQGSFECSLSRRCVTNSADMGLIETLFDYYNGFLVWLCGGTTEQFIMDRVGWRYHDLYLMTIVSEYKPEWADGFYSRGMNVDIDLVETI